MELFIIHLINHFEQSIDVQQPIFDTPCCLPASCHATLEKRRQKSQNHISVNIWENRVKKKEYWSLVCVLQNGCGCKWFGLCVIEIFNFSWHIPFWGGSNNQLWLSFFSTDGVAQRSICYWLHVQISTIGDKNSLRCINSRESAVMQQYAKTRIFRVYRNVYAAIWCSFVKTVQAVVTKSLSFSFVYVWDVSSVMAWTNSVWCWCTTVECIVEKNEKKFANFRVFFANFCQFFNDYCDEQSIISGPNDQQQIIRKRSYIS